MAHRTRAWWRSMALAICLVALTASGLEAARSRAPVGARAKARQAASARGKAARPRSPRRLPTATPVTARSARAAIIRALDAGAPAAAGLRAGDLGVVRVVGTYRKGEGKGVANQTGFVAETTILAAEFISPSHPLGRRIETFAIAPALGTVEVFPGHPRWRLTMAAAQEVAVERARRDHGPGAFAWAVGISRSGKSVWFESIDHAGRRDRYLVRLDKAGNRIAVQRGALPRLPPAPPETPLDLSSETRARIAEILRSIENRR